MNLEYKCGVLASEHGIKLLEDDSNFIKDIWENPKVRGTPEEIGDKTFTKVSCGDKILYEKTGTSENELRRYATMDDIIQEKGYKHVRIAEVYFAKDDKILLKFYEYPITFGSIMNLKMLSKEANDEAINLLESVPSSMNWCVEENGDLIVIDPHIDFIAKNPS